MSKVRPLLPDQDEASAAARLWRDHQFSMENSIANTARQMDFFASGAKDGVHVQLAALEQLTLRADMAMTFDEVTTISFEMHGDIQSWLAQLARLYPPYLLISTAMSQNTQFMLDRNVGLGFLEYYKELTIAMTDLLHKYVSAVRRVEDARADSTTMDILRYLREICDNHEGLRDLLLGVDYPILVAFLFEPR